MEDWNGREKIVADNVVTYQVGRRRTQEVSCGKDLLRLVGERAKEYFEGYLWHGDGFRLVEAEEEGGEVVMCGGAVYYGDNVEDEWLITSFLVALTREVEGLAVSVRDSDGEFLLIEVAEYLPDWVTPEHAEGRVYVFQGALHIIPLPTDPKQLFTIPVDDSLPSALPLLADPSVPTRLNTECQRVLQARLQPYPAMALRNSYYYAHCLLPPRAAYLLGQLPSWIARAVQSYYLRVPAELTTAVSLRVLDSSPDGRGMDLGRPERKKEETEGWVYARVRFTRCLYAMITAQPDPPRCFSAPSGPPAVRKAISLGRKVAVGLEMALASLPSNRLASLCKYPANAQIPDETLSASIDEYSWGCDPRWHRHLDRIRRRAGYFDTDDTDCWELSGTRIRQMKRAYLLALVDQQRRGRLGDMSGKFCMEVVDDILAQYDNLVGGASGGAEQCHASVGFLPAPGVDDDSSWLAVDPSEVDDLLQKYRGLCENPEDLEGG
eukprot:CAMPEP_0119123976 /NCGR_PEP_ID=MMETSP1310-20130426/3731_1 /TAXON_ID=464262 /ORGANISM="Genus nov. species nov., Strain RCC2339" /LENGTH=492 /DNA_ID=CAMNT_0007113853 /DNA_START=115 /DNA_END=1589 /DNA_ORIENTATION=-